MHYQLNDKSYVVTEDADLTRRLLDVIRIDHGLTGTKEGCGEGECGACLVLIDGQIFNACLVPLGNALGCTVVTIEHFATTEAFRRISDALIRCGAVQCGYCTPGMVMAIASLLKSDPRPTDLAIKEALAGNLCRCTGYQTLFDAVKEVANSDSSL